MKVKYYDLENKRVFVTGGGSGIGASIVEHFCEQGSEVYFVDIDLKETKKLLNKIKKKKEYLSRVEDQELVLQLLNIFANKVQRFTL